MSKGIILSHPAAKIFSLETGEEKAIEWGMLFGK